MRKMIFWILGIVAVIVLLTKASDLADLAGTIRTGAIIPLILAVVFQLARYVMQALSTQSAFNTIGVKPAPLKRLIALIVGGIFINTLAPTGGTAGAALIVDDAVKRDQEPTQAATASILELLCHFVGFIIIMFIGFIILQFTGRLDNLSFILGMVLVLLISFFSGILFYCHKNTKALIALFKKIEAFVEKVCAKIHKQPPKPWAERIVLQLSDASESILAHPTQLASTIGLSALGYGCEMLCFVCVGFAFGVTAINVLIASYVMTTVFSIVSPAPNGVGFAEAAATIALTGYGSSVATATAIALVFRGFVFWIPFAIGAVMLRQSGFFNSKKSATEEDKAKVTGYIAGLFVFVLGILNVLFCLLPSISQKYELLTEWFGIGEPFSSTAAVVLGMLFMLLARGMIRRSRTTWAWALVLIVFLAAAQLVSAGSGTFYVVIPLIALAIWLFVKWRDFDQREPIYDSRRRRYMPFAFAIFITILYTVCGYMMLGKSCFGFEHSFTQGLLAAAKTIIPGLADPTPINAYGAWFQSSVPIILLTTFLWAFAVVITPYIQRKLEESGTRLMGIQPITDDQIERVVAAANEGRDENSGEAFLGSDDKSNLVARRSGATFAPKITAPHGTIPHPYKKKPVYTGTFRKK